MGKKYRTNVAAILQATGGELLIGQRSDYRACWQFPQGGADNGESLEEALAREVAEEVGVRRSDYEVVGQRGPYRYDFPSGPDRRGFCGQEQTYFLCRLKEPGTPAIDLGSTCGEFAATRWVQPRDFPVHLAPPMKQAVYRQVLRDFFPADSD